MPAIKKIRIDQWLVERGLAPSRERAQAIIMAGKVWVGEKRIQKASQTVSPDDPVRVQGPDHPYVSRGGVKLKEALLHFGVAARGRIGLDIGSSTGGFTDCLLQEGARKVYAFDSGTHQLHERLRSDTRVVLRENFNARHLTAADLPEVPDLVVVDVSFISLKLILPPLREAVTGAWEGLFLVKPQFEAGPRDVGRGGVVKDEAVRERVVGEIRSFAAGLGLTGREALPCGLKGEAGNQEFFLHLRRPAYNS